ncbi:MAG: hypothetical protein K6B68_14355 [Eubacterium sp.]|nr:hypothetical protein [Eubacterium sp.]
MKIGIAKFYNKEDRRDFKIVDIPDEAQWRMDLYLSVIIRDYLRAFIQNTPAIGNCVIADESPLYQATDDDWKKWDSIVNSVADEFDDLVELIKAMDEADNISDLQIKKKELQDKAFANLAYIYDDLC